MWLGICNSENKKILHDVKLNNFIQELIKIGCNKYSKLNFTTEKELMILFRFITYRKCCY